MPHHTSCTFDIIAQESYAVALAFGVPAAGALAEALLDRLRVSLGGERLYLPKRDQQRRAGRDAAIRAQFNGRNIGELARKHGVSARWVRKIVGSGAPLEKK
jgi:Mor family transcriptional regulator